LRRSQVGVITTAAAATASRPPVTDALLAIAGLLTYGMDVTATFTGRTRPRVDGGIARMAAGVSVMNDSNALRRARQRAKSLSSKDGISHQKALDRIAVEAGHANWGAMLAAHPKARAVVPFVADAEATMEPDWTLADLRHAFAHRWERESVIAGATPFEHYVGASIALSASNGAVLPNGGAGIRILAMCALAMSSWSPKGDPNDVLRWANDLAVTAMRALVRSRSEASAAKQYSTATLAREFVTVFRGETPGDLVGDDVLEGIANLSDRQMETILADYSDILTRRAVINPHDFGSVSSAIPVGIVAMVLARNSVRIPLADDERTLLSELVRSSDIEDVDDHRERLRSLRVRSAALRDVVDALWAVVPLHGRTDLASWIAVPSAILPRREGRMLDIPLMSSEGLERISAFRESVFASWLVDAVGKVERGSSPFRFNPLADDGRGPYEGMHPEDWRNAQDAVSRIAIMGVYPEDAPGADRAASSLTATVGLVERGIARGSIREIGPISGDRPTMSSVASVLRTVRSRGVDQVLLYGRIVGLESRDLDSLAALGEDPVLSMIESALSPFSSPLMQGATG